MKHVKIINTFASDDEDFSSDETNIELQVDGQRVMDGDYYHDKISEQIDGFLRAMEWFSIPFTKEEVNQNEEGYDSEGEDEEDEDETEEDE